MRLVFLGAPGSGKGTQSQIISEHYKIPVLSTGAILRSEIANKTTLGLEVQAIMDSGQLVSDDIMIQIITNRLSKPDVQSGFILDGFPRTVNQAEELSKILSNIFGESKITVLNLVVPEGELLLRFAGRFSCAQCGANYHRVYKQPIRIGVCDKCGANDFMVRKDDSEAAVKVRLEFYNSKTAPLVDYYRHTGQLIEIDGMKSIADISATIIDILDKKVTER